MQALIKVRESSRQVQDLNIEVRSRNHCWRGKVMNITYPDSVSLSLCRLRHAKRMRCIILSVAGLSRKRHDFLEKKVIEHNMYVLIFSTTFEAFLILSRIQRDMQVHRSSGKILVTLVRF